MRLRGRFEMKPRLVLDKHYSRPMMHDPDPEKYVPLYLSREHDRYLWKIIRNGRIYWWTTKLAEPEPKSIFVNGIFSEGFDHYYLHPDKMEPFGYLTYKGKGTPSDPLLATHDPNCLLSADHVPEFPCIYPYVEPFDLGDKT